MRAALSAVVAAGLAIALAWWVSGLSGTIEATISGVTVETSAPVAALAFALLATLIYVTVRAMLWLIDIPRQLGRWRQGRRLIAGDASVARTLVALAANDGPGARTESARARRLLGDSPQTLLHCAEAARLAGHEDEAAAFFEKLAGREDGRFLGLRGLFRLAIAREDWAEAQRLATNAEALRPGALWLREERTQLAVRLGNWTQALALAGPETPKNALVVAASQAEPDGGRALRLARRVFEENPTFAPAAVAFALRLRSAGKDNRAQETLRAAWSRAPHPDIAACYMAPFTDKLIRVREGAALARANPRHAESQVLMAGLALDAGLLLEARKHADSARTLGLNDQRLWRIIARLPDSDPVETKRSMSNATPDSGWICDSCGTLSASWLPACQNCHIAGRMVWGTGLRPGMLVEGKAKTKSASLTSAAPPD